jgi:TM2 domain-containing membrane protein YozV
MDEKIVIQQKPAKSPAAAGILSVILPGLGNIYNGFANKGLLHLVVFAGLLALLITAATAGNAVAIVFTALMLGGFWFYQIIDSVNTAKALNLAALKQEPEVTPKAEELPALVTSGSIFWGAVLIVIGVLAILANFDVIRWETLWDFWPLAVIVIGLKLVFDSVAKAKKNGKDAN